MISNKKLSSLCKTIKNLKNDITTFKLNKKNNPIESYKLSHPNTRTSKKYSCLLLNNIDSNISDELNDFCDNKKLHCVKLDKGDYVINYSITLENNTRDNSCEIFLATQVVENNKKKFKSIIGTFVSTSSLNINNTILYTNTNNNTQNLYVIIKLNNCYLHDNKNLLKIIKLN